MDGDSKISNFIPCVYSGDKAFSEKLNNHSGFDLQFIFDDSVILDHLKVIGQRIILYLYR